MHIAVCDDEPATLAYLSELVRRWGEGRADPVRVERFPSAPGAVVEWEAKPCFDLFLLDIQMQGLDGVTLARKIRAAVKNARSFSSQARRNSQPMGMTYPPCITC